MLYVFVYDEKKRTRDIIRVIEYETVTLKKQYNTLIGFFQGATDCRSLTVEVSSVSF